MEEENTIGEHTPEESWQYIVVGDCVSDTVRQKLCTTCRDTAVVEVIPAPGHTPSATPTVIREASCTLGATNAILCTECDYVIEQSTTEPLGHTEGAWTQVASASCAEDGLKQQKCSVCNSVIAIEAIAKLGHEFDIEDGATVTEIIYANGLDAEGVTKTKCVRCTETNDGTIGAIFEAVGYSVGPDGYSLKAGFLVDTIALNAYKQLYPSFSFGLIMVNANSISESDALFIDNELNASAKGLKIAVDNVKYVTWNADIAGFNATIADSLEIAIGIYVVDGEGNLSVIQYSDAEKYATMKTFSDMTLNAITFNQVRVGHELDALVPPSSNDD